MKRSVAIGLALVLVLTLGLVATAAVGASDAVYDNWRGVLAGRDVTRDGHYYGDAEGHVVFNYRKGQGNYMVNLVARGLNPGEEYEVKFLAGEPGAWDMYQTVGYFTADSDGEGHLNVRGFSPDVTHFDEQPEAFFSVYKGAWRLLTTSEARAGELGAEDIEPVGSNRGE